MNFIKITNETTSANNTTQKRPSGVLSKKVKIARPIPGELSEERVPLRKEEKMVFGSHPK